MDRNRRVDHQDVIASAGLDQRNEVCLQAELRVGDERRNSRDRSGDRQQGMAVSRLMQGLHRADGHTAPGLSSTTTFQPSPSDRAVAMMRARMSGGVLADAGTTIRMAFEGKDCANADPKAAPPQPIAAAPAKNSRLFMAFPFICWPPVRDASSECLRLHPSYIIFRNERFHAVGRSHQASPETA